MMRFMPGAVLPLFTNVARSIPSPDSLPLNGCIPSDQGQESGTIIVTTYPPGWTTCSADSTTTTSEVLFSSTSLAGILSSDVNPAPSSNGDGTINSDLSGALSTELLSALSSQSEALQLPASDGIPSTSASSSISLDVMTSSSLFDSAILSPSSSTRDTSFDPHMAQPSTEAGSLTSLPVLEPVITPSAELSSPSSTAVGGELWAIISINSLDQLVEATSTYTQSSGLRPIFGIPKVIPFPVFPNGTLPAVPSTIHRSSSEQNTLPTSAASSDVGSSTMMSEPQTQSTITSSAATSLTTLSSSSAQITSITTTNSLGETTIIPSTIGSASSLKSSSTQALVLTTATDSRGSVIVGTITMGPSPPSPTVPLTTFTAFPPDFSTSTTSVATNTHDSSGHPILGPWPLCWFCEPGTDGIVIAGLLAGVYPAGLQPPGFPVPLPAITILPDGDPQYSPQEPTTTISGTGSQTDSRSSCTSTVTVTDVTVIVSISVDSSASTTATSTVSTISAAVSGCSITASTATSTASASCSSGCCPAFEWTSDSDPDPDPENDDFHDGINKRADIWRPSRTQGIAGRITLPTRDPGLLRPRDGNRRSVTSFSNCNLLSTIFENDYPIVASYNDAAFAGKVSKYFVTTVPPAVEGNACPLPTAISVADLASASVLYSGKSTTYVISQTDAPWVNSDHVYELKTLKDFFNDMMSMPNAPSCDDFNKWFFPDRLSNIYKLMPGNDYPDFAAMDSKVNEKKGKILDRSGWVVGKKAKTPHDILEAIVGNGIAVAMINQPAIVELYQRTHQRLYEGFLGLDDAISQSQCVSGAVPSGISATWADSYSRWMETFLASQGTLASVRASSAYARLAGSGEDTAAAMQKYPPEAFFITQSAAMARLSRTTTRAVKRQVCSLSQPTETSSAIPAPSPPTSAVPLPVPSRSPPTCAPQEDTHCSIPDIQPNTVADQATEFCGLPDIVGKVMDSTTANVTHVYYTRELGYMMNVGWIPGCQGNPMDVVHPLGANDPSDCQAIVHSSYTDCNNNGHGGYVDVGCLRYGFYPEVSPQIYGFDGLPTDYFVHNSPCPAVFF